MQIVQTTSKFYHQLWDSRFGQAQDLFDNPTSFHPGDHMLNLDTYPSKDLIQRGRSHPHATPLRFDTLKCNFFIMH